MNSMDPDLILMVASMILGSLLMAFILLSVIPFIQGFKEAVENHKVKKELIKKFEE